MTAPSGKHALVVFSPQPSVADFLKRLLDSAGFCAFPALFRTEDLEAIVRRNRPDAVVYDIGYPFVENWHELQRLRTHGALRDIPVVITTADARELQHRVGVSPAIELFRRPDDLTELQAAICAAIETPRLFVPRDEDTENDDSVAAADHSPPGQSSGRSRCRRDRDAKVRTTNERNCRAN